jgi:hypothetical protein
LVSKDKNGLTTRKTKVTTYLDGVGLTEDQIMGLNGYTVDLILLLHPF